MDYLNRVLGRQRALWNAVLTGGGETAAEAEKDAGEAAAAAEAQAAARRRFPPESTEIPAPEAAEENAGAALVRLPGLGGAETDAALLRQLTAAALARAPETLAAGSRDGGGTETKYGSKPAPEAAGAAADQREEPILLRREDESAEAQALSRRLERDARRYDGGFIFY